MHRGRCPDLSSISHSPTHAPAERLPADFYLRDAVEVARDLLGKVLCSHFDGQLTEAVITETEAYAGTGDRASHAFGGRRTARTEPMYREGGVAYIYLCYGIHHLFNVVTGKRDDPQAVLLRAGEPLRGIDEMRVRRNKTAGKSKLMAGPGSLSQALGIHTKLSGVSLFGDELWIEDHQLVVTDEDIVVGPRIGIDYAGDDAARPYRFVLTSMP
ncbi:MAG: DNA-3-methyladenine glycosylase [Woeseiaceae bacterium]|nr:DNA-3-methyladenine glycosylase [Woeseiaceae bacterium]